MFFIQLALIKCFLELGICAWSLCTYPTLICLSDWNANISYNYSLIKTVDLDTINLPSPIGVQTIPTLAVLISSRLIFILP